MSISDQALSLLDIQPSKAKRQCLDSFASLESEIIESIAPAPVGEASPAAPASVADLLSSVQTPFAMAARMGRPDYEEKAKAEALHEALRQMRAKHAAKRSPRVIRGS